MSRKSIHNHEGKKYLRRIHAADGSGSSIFVDVYEVLHAFHVHDAAIGHAIKKLLCSGQRGKGNDLDDLHGAMAALNRAIDIKGREYSKASHEVASVTKNVAMPSCDEASCEPQGKDANGDCKQDEDITQKPVLRIVHLIFNDGEEMTTSFDRALDLYEALGRMFQDSEAAKQ